MEKLLLSFVIPLIGFSQYPNTPIFLNSQADVDAFTVNYPNCMELNNSLYIEGSDISSLIPLSGITSLSD